MIIEQSKKIYSVEHKDESTQISFEGELTMENGLIVNLNCRVKLDDNHYIGFVSSQQKFESAPLTMHAADMKAPESLLITSITISVPEKYRDDVTRILDEVIDGIVNEC